MQSQSGYRAVCEAQDPFRECDISPKTLSARELQSKGRLRRAPTSDSSGSSQAAFQIDCCPTDETDSTAAFETHGTSLLFQYTPDPA